MSQQQDSNAALIASMEQLLKQQFAVALANAKRSMETEVQQLEQRRTQLLAEIEQLEESKE